MNFDSRLRRLTLRQIARTALALTPVPALLPAAAFSQAWPTRPITIVVPSLPGGGSDGGARAMAAELSKRLNQSVLVENVAGASGGIGAARVQRAAPDGYTLLAANSDLVLATLVQKNPGYCLAGLTPIANLGSSPLSLIARVRFPAQNIEQLIAQARANPGKIGVGVSGAAALPALGVVMFEDAAKIELLRVPYKGAAQVMTDLSGGQIGLAVTAAVNVVGAVRSGQVRMLGVFSKEKFAIAPDFPLIGDTPATRNVALDIWLALFGPAGLPPAVLNQINAAVQATLADPVYVAARARIGESPAKPASAEEFARFIAAETARYKAAATRLPSE